MRGLILDHPFGNPAVWEVCLSLRREDGAGEEALRQTVSRVAFSMADVSITSIPDGSKE